MIKVTITRNKEQAIQHFSISGHAQYDEPGKDIVCAAVSGISFGTLNAIEALLEIELSIEMDESSGLLSCDLPDHLEKQTKDKLQLLLEGMVISLESVAAEYGQYIQIKQ